MMMLNQKENNFKEGDGLKMNMRGFCKRCNFMAEIGRKFKIMCEHDHQPRQGLMLKNTFRNSIDQVILMMTNKDFLLIKMDF